eukprot:6586368-Prorocentrum_lima.AAC.1
MGTAIELPQALRDKFRRTMESHRLRVEAPLDFVGLHAGDQHQKPSPTAVASRTEPREEEMRVATLEEAPNQ